MTEDMLGADICRVCRSEGLADRPLFHPCICTGSIKWIHQECLMQWMRYSRKEYCELCGYWFSFTPIYSPDMPRRLPLRDVIGGLFSSIVTAVKYWLHYSLVAFGWLCIVPLSACRTYKALFSGRFDLVRIMSLPMDMLSAENVSSDVFHGCFVVTCTLLAFTGLVWLREQILHAGDPDWLDRDNVQLPPVDNPPNMNAPAQQAQERRGMQEQEQGQDNNNVPPFVDEPPIVHVRHQQPVPVNADAHPLYRRIEEPNLPNNQGIHQPEVVQRQLDAVPVPGPMPVQVPLPVIPVEQFHQHLDAPNININANGNVNANANANANANVNGNNAAAADGWRPMQGQAQGEAEEANWNPMEWGRPAEELTWERLLGLDGSLAFVEHIFWVVSLNTLFIMVFAFCPYHIGSFAITGLGIRSYAAASHFEGLVTTLCGYCVIGFDLAMLHTLAALLGFQRFRRILGLCYVIVKVSLILVVEMGVIRLVCGWWLDICSLGMFDATLRDRESSFRSAPGASMFIHWLAGMIYVYYFASITHLLREILRPGVLWFLRNLNDPDFSPIQEMIHLPILPHIKRLVTSAVIYGTTILLIVWLPVKILRWAWPGFLPYTLTVQSEAQVSELSLELLVMQIIVPVLLEQKHSRTWLKALITAWCRVVAWMLDLESYLLREQTEEQGGAAVIEEPQHPDLGAAHQALVQRERPTGFQPYVRPRWFPARLVGLLLCVCISLVIVTLIAMTLPVWVGRKVMAIWTGPSYSPLVFLLSLGDSEGSERVAPLNGRVHETYTITCGIYVCWGAVRGLTLAFSLLPRGRRAIVDRIKYWAIVGMKASVAFVLLFGIIPLLFGLLLELVVLVPLRVPLGQTPILFIMQDWILGVLYTKIATAVTMMGPEWRIRLAIEKAYTDGIRDMDLKFIITELAAPVICCFGLALAVPYAVAKGIVPLIISNPETRILIARRLYPYLFLGSLICVVIRFQIRQFKKLYEHIKNDKYLVGRRLVNYEHRNKTQLERSLNGQLNVDAE